MSTCLMSHNVNKFDVNKIMQAQHMVLSRTGRT